MKLIQITMGMTAIVDSKSYKRIVRHKWHAAAGGKRGCTWYAARSLPRLEGTPRKKMYMHHEVLPPKKGFEIDHRNGNGLDNRRRNLRYATVSQNRANRRKIPHSSTYKGVYWHSRDRRWKATIRFSGRQIDLGCFTDEVKAARAYNKAAKRLHGRFCVLNSF
jgi:hypothetical protein